MLPSTDSILCPPCLLLHSSSKTIVFWANHQTVLQLLSIHDLTLACSTCLLLLQSDQHSFFLSNVILPFFFLLSVFFFLSNLSSKPRKSVPLLDTTPVPLNTISDHLNADPLDDFDLLDSPIKKSPSKFRQILLKSLLFSFLAALFLAAVTFRACWIPYPFSLSTSATRVFGGLPCEPEDGFCFGYSMLTDDGFSSLEVVSILNPKYVNFLNSKKSMSSSLSVEIRPINDRTVIKTFTTELEQLESLSKIWKFSVFAFDLNHGECYSFTFKFNDLSNEYTVCTLSRNQQFQIISGGGFGSSHAAFEFSEAVMSGKFFNQGSKLSKKFDIFLFTGDYVTDCGQIACYRPWLQFFKNLQNISPKSPFSLLHLVPVLGNEDVYYPASEETTGNNRSPLFDFFFNSQVHQNLTLRSFDLHFYRLFTLDSGHVTSQSKQIDYIEQQLDGLHFSIAGYHLPMYSLIDDGNNGEARVKEWEELFLKRGLDAAVEGHGKIAKILKINETLFIGDGLVNGRPNDINIPEKLKSSVLFAQPIQHLHCFLLSIDSFLVETWRYIDLVYNSGARLENQYEKKFD
ncbi:hypothetical protein GEMRC1_009239 [Eukaryota sp. GEM-RC1]